LSGFFLTSAHGQPVRRLGDEGCGNQKRQGGNSSKHEKATPSDLLAQQCHHGRTNENADRNERRYDSARDPPPAGRHELLQQGNIGGIDPRGSQADEKPNDRDVGPIALGREGERCRAEAEEDDRRQKDRAPTDAIGRSAKRKLPITAPTPEESNMTVVAPKVRCQGFATKAITKLIRKKSRKSNICAAAETRNDV
jgi:hypothetical protein